jgi:hypothetical protein
MYAIIARGLSMISISDINGLSLVFFGLGGRWLLVSVGYFSSPVLLTVVILAVDDGSSSYVQPGVPSFPDCRGFGLNGQHPIF